LRIVTPRSVVLGILGVVLICAITPFNTYGLNYTDTIGGALPTGVVFMLLIGGVVNGLLAKYAPKRSLGIGEFGLVVGMWLVGCSFPSVGLMRYLPGHLVQYQYLYASDAGFARAAREMNLPQWLWPTVDTSTDVARMTDPVVRDFVGRIPGSADKSLVEQIWNVPWRAWMAPTIAWGSFVALLFGAVLCMTLVFRKQWVENERIPFPLASVYLSLIEPPSPGRRFNALFSSKLFWIAFAGVVVLHGINGLSRYDPEHVPPLPLTFNLISIMSERPWSFMDQAIMYQRLSFTFVGIVYFVDTRVALSIWLAFVLVQVFKVFATPQGVELTGSMATDQSFGAAVGFAGMAMWLARRHLADVARQMFSGSPGTRTDAGGRYLPNAVAGWGLLGCMAGLVVWLWLAGASVVGAVVLVTLLMTTFLVLTKVVAETGLLYVLISMEFYRPWASLAQDVPAAMKTRTTLGSYFWSTFFSGVLAHDTRNAMTTYVSSALRVTDLTGDEDTPRPAQIRRAGKRWRWGLVGCLALAALVGFLVSGASWLWLDYTYASTLDRTQETPLASWGTFYMPRVLSMVPVTNYLPPADGPIERHNRLVHEGFGAIGVVALGVLRLSFVGWPLHPVGFLLMHTWGVRVTWFSVFLGWLAKVLVIRLTGAAGFAKAKPAFLGLIVGEAFMLAFWIIVALLRLSMGMTVEHIRLLPV
jgi:hypothetical protein